MKGMEVISSQALWKEYDRKGLPLNESVISTKTENGVTETRFYFSGVSAPDGVARIYARLVRPDSPHKTPVIIVLGDLADDIDKMTADCPDKWAVLYVDYSGKKDVERYTMYPESMRFAEPYYTPDTMGESSVPPQKTCWYIWATVLLRAVTFAESREELDGDAIAAIGLGVGGGSIWKAAGLKAIKCGVIVNESGEKIDDMGYKAALDSAAYAGWLTVPVLSVCCSNALRYTLDEVSETVALNENCYLNVRPRAFLGIDGRQIDTVRTFLQTVIDGTGLPKRPKLSLRGSDGALYCELTLDSEPAEIRLNVSNSPQAPGLRNWQKFGMESIGENRYMTRVDVTDTDSPVYAFARVAYLNGLTLCSEVIEADPKKLGITLAAHGKSRLIYDGDMGVDDWIAGDGGEAEVMTGPFGIEGVGAVDALSTFKLSDRAYTGEPGCVLQILLHSSVDQTVAFKILTKTGEVHFALRDLKRNDDWVKLTFDVTDFKSGDGTLDSWDKVATLRLTFDGVVIVSNLLWV